MRTKLVVMRRALLVFEPPDGGVVECVRQLAVGLEGHDWTVELAGPPEAAIYPAVEQAGIQVERLPFGRGYGEPPRELRALRRLTELLRERRYDVVHCHAAKAGVLARLAAVAAATPVVYSPHCFPFVGTVGARRRVAATVAERAFARLTAATICVCEEERRIALASGIGPAARLRVVLNASAVADGVKPDSALIDLRGDGQLVAAIAVLREQKRLDVFLEAVPIVLARAPAARLVIVGDGPLGARLRAHASALGLDGEDRFAFLPFQASAASYLAATDLYVLTSSWEAMPLGVLEALAAGVPQIATRVGGTAEAVTPETGVLVDPGDPVGVADAIVELLADPERRAAMSRASRERHHELFAVDRMVRETAAIYDEVAYVGRRRRLLPR
ncbi:MAG: glycosyltransferase [Solirubrobacteraceae bacterium]